MSLRLFYGLFNKLFTSGNVSNIYKHTSPTHSLKAPQSYKKESIICFGLFFLGRYSFAEFPHLTPIGKALMPKGSGAPKTNPEASPSLGVSNID